MRVAGVFVCQAGLVGSTHVTVESLFEDRRDVRERIAQRQRMRVTVDRLLQVGSARQKELIGKAVALEEALVFLEVFPADLLEGKAIRAPQGIGDQRVR